jgi:hypothetical protein
MGFIVNNERNSVNVGDWHARLYDFTYSGLDIFFQ